MDQNYVNPYDKEYMRLAILKHEETFKHQVHELHRLYRIQKLLMRNIAKEKPNYNSQLQTHQQNNNKFDLDQRPVDHHEDYAAEEESSGRIGVVKQLIIDENEIELTLGPSSYSSSRRKSRKKPESTLLVSPLTSDSGGATFSSSNSTGSSTTHNKRQDDDHQLGIFQVPNNITNLANNNYQNHDNNVDDKLRQERLKQTPWLFQVLSLNLTN